MKRRDSAQRPAVDTSSRAQFFDYYAEASLSEATKVRYRQIFNTIVGVLGADRTRHALDVADVGCGAGAQCLLWAEEGHRVYGLDINARLIELARERAAEKRLDVSLSVGTAAALPWSNGSMDVCIMPELLEHVEDWQGCLSEAVRVLRQGGVLYLTTTNWLCPVQQEFNLPVYSWYPSPVKRYCEHLARTTRPDLANYATYPAVNWFSYRKLRAALRPLGFDCLDRFETAAEADDPIKRLVLSVLKTIAPLRALAQIASPYTQVVAIKHCAVTESDVGGATPYDASDGKSMMQPASGS